MGIKKISAAGLVASIALVVAIPVAFATSAVDAPDTGSLAANTLSDVPPAVEETYVATLGAGDDAVRLGIDCTAEEWEGLAAFLHDQFVAPSHGENHTTVAQFRVDALERFGIPEGGSLNDNDFLARLAADPELRVLARGHSPWTTTSDTDSAIAAYTYYGLLPLLSSDWEAHAFTGSVSVPGDDGETFSYQMTVRVEDPEVTYVTHVIDNVLAFERQVGDLLELAVEADPSDANELLQAFGVEFRNEFAMRVRLCSDASLQLNYSVFDFQGNVLANGGSELVVLYEDLTQRRVTVRQATAADLFVALDPFGVTYEWMDAGEEGLDGLPYYAVWFDGMPVARIYDSQGGFMVTDLVQPTPDVAYEQAGPDAVDLVVEYDADGNLADVRIAEEGEIEALQVAATEAVAGADAMPDTSNTESREVMRYVVPETDNGYTDAQWEQVIDLWSRIDGNEAFTVADFLAVFEDSEFATPSGNDLLGRFTSDGKLQEARTTNDLASFVCNTLALLPHYDAQPGNPIYGLAIGADGSAMFQYSILASVDGDPSEVSVLGWQRTLEDTITCAEGILEQIDAEDLEDAQLMGYMLGDLVASGVELHTPGVSLVVGGTYTSPSGESVQVSPVAVDQVRPVYPVNENGQTYGSAADAMALGADLPDLVLVQGKNGTTGYALREDWLFPTPSNPEEAAAMMESGELGPREIPVYAQDGETVVDTMVLGSDATAQ